MIENSYELFYYTTAAMGNSWSHKDIIDEDRLSTYAELTFLKRKQIVHIIYLLDNVDPGKLRENLQHRFAAEQIDVILPQIQCSPFRDSIYRVFSSQKDNHLSLEDVLDLYSAFCGDCPDEVRASWAFYIFDLDGDKIISTDDLIEAVKKLAGCEREDADIIEDEQAEHIAELVLKEMVFNRAATISREEFTHFVARIPEFFSAFHFRI
ncbi:calcium and integrin-binding protein 1 isoform X1 [Megalopta genalis]|uniref:calcium and integrin-binding protein 1 isoform X1 n=1 Tax=Megalopta genalis TaxID=115081 RepID=UPI003FD3639C